MKFSSEELHSLCGHVPPVNRGMCHTTRSQILNLAQVGYRTSESLANRAAFWLSKGKANNKHETT